MTQVQTSSASKMFAGRQGAKPFTFTITKNGKDKTISHWPVLAFMEGDLMMMYKLMLTLPHSAAKACPRCTHTGTFLGGAMRCNNTRSQLRVGEPVLVDDDIDWKDKGELMYTAYELHARAKHMQNWYAKQKAKIVPPLHELPVTKRTEQWEKLVNAHQRETKRVGVRGMSICAQLSYFRCAAKLISAIQPPFLGWCCRHAVGGHCGQLAHHALQVQ